MIKEQEKKNNRECRYSAHSIIFTNKNPFNQLWAVFLSFAADFFHSPRKKNERMSGRAIKENCL